jgi:hypothetical protein
VTLPSNLIDPDIRCYGRTRLCDDKALQWPSDSLMEEIEKCLTEGARRMYVGAGGTIDYSQMWQRSGKGGGGGKASVGKTHLQVSLGRLPAGRTAYVLHAESGARRAALAGDDT